MDVLCNNYPRFYNKIIIFKNHIKLKKYINFHLQLSDLQLSDLTYFVGYLDCFPVFININDGLSKFTCMFNKYFEKPVLRECNKK